jgi:hypothetical protein
MPSPAQRRTGTRSDRPQSGAAARRGGATADPTTSGNELCCCPCLNAYVWIETDSVNIAVENATIVEEHLDTKRHLDSTANADAKPTLELRASTNASVNAPGAPQVNADSLAAGKTADDTESDGKATLDESVKKDVSVRREQAKVYRKDTYTVHWQAEGEGQLHVSLLVNGVIAYAADWLPKSGSVRLSKDYMLHPPIYDPGGPNSLTAMVQVTDCNNKVVVQSNTAPRP